MSRPAALIRPQDWATERGAIEQEIRAQESQPFYRIGMKLRASFFKGTPYAQATGGTVASFEKMQSADIQRFYHTWYSPSNATVIIAGDIDPQQTLAQIHTLFDHIPAVPVPTRTPMVVAPSLSALTVSPRLGSRPSSAKTNPPTEL